MPGQEKRKKSVRQKLNAMGAEFKNKNVLIVDDSIVRGTTSKEIVQMARDSGANRVTFTSAAPPVRFPHVYGINMPSRKELIAYNKSNQQIEKELSVDHLIYQDVPNLKKSIVYKTEINNLDLSCFDGNYITNNITEEYLNWVEEEYLS